MWLCPQFSCSDTRLDVRVLTACLTEFWALSPSSQPHCFHQHRGPAFSPSPRATSLGQGLPPHAAQTRPPCGLSDTSSPPCLDLCSCHPLPGMPFLQIPLNSGLDSAAPKEPMPFRSGHSQPCVPAPCPPPPALQRLMTALFCAFPEMRIFLFAAVSATLGAGPDALQVLSKHLRTGHIPAYVPGLVLSGRAGRGFWRGNKMRLPFPATVL